MNTDLEGKCRYLFEVLYQHSPEEMGKVTKPHNQGRDGRNNVTEL
jgi:hypothetical protein